jgi:hypothetical protein
MVRREVRTCASTLVGFLQSQVVLLPLVVKSLCFFSIRISFMSRYRDNKGRFIASKISEKLEKQTTRNPPPPPPHTLIHLKFVQEKFSEEKVQRKQLKQQPKALNLKPLFRLKA